MKEYYLIGLQVYKSKVIDKVVAQTLTEAEKQFRARNDFEKLLKKWDLNLSESKRYYS